MWVAPKFVETFSHAFHEQGQSHSAAHAESREPTLCVPFFHLVEERCGYAHTGAADRMAQRNSAAIHIEPFGVETKIAIAGDHLSSESFIQLDQDRYQLRAAFDAPAM